MGKRIVISGPRGAGKGTLVEHALSRFGGQHGLRRMVSTTSRPRRPLEVNGTHYNFRRPEEIRALWEVRELFWVENIGGHLYGLERCAAEVPCGIIDVHPPGARIIRDWATAQGDKTLLVGVFAPRGDRLRRLVEREKGLYNALLRLAKDPVSPNTNDYADFDLRIENGDLMDYEDGGRISPGFTEALDRMKKFLFEG